MPLHVVLRGATGFIGSAILAEMLSQEMQVTVLLRSSSDTSRIDPLSPFESIYVDGLADKSTINKLRESVPDVFIDCAWKGVGGRDRNQSFQITENLPFTLQGVELAAAIGCKQWIGFGSQAEYGNQNRRLDETAQLTPTTLYGKAKLASGISALALCEARNLTGVWMRIFSIYGPGDAPNWFVPYVAQEFLAGRSPQLTKCEQLWDYLYVEDAARAVCAVADQSTTGVFNLASGIARPLKDFVEAIRDELNTQIEPIYGAVDYRPDQVMHLEADISRLTEAVNWQPTATIEQGIKSTLAFECVRSQSACNDDA